jgi:CheY-like chemotaxis protein
MVRRFADMGLQAAERGTRLTAQLLAFSRVQRMELKPVAVADILNGMRELLERTLGPMIHLRLDIHAEGLRVMSDPTQLEMAVLNLAINARDAMPDGGDLTLTARPLTLKAPDAELPAGAYAEIVVADTGEGMDETVASRAFDPFFTTKEVGKGTGLGLSQVYGIARQGGGGARIESRPGEGTRVRLLLPLIAREDTAAGADEGGNVGADQRRLAKVLVIDDDALMRETLSEALRALGHTVTAASGGREGLHLLQHEAHDVVILDFAMPGMNGADVAAEAVKIRPGVPIVFSTGYSNTTAIEAAAGSDAIVLRKPFMIETLDRTIGAVLGKT